MTWLIVLFWVFFALAIHPYVTYPLILSVWSRLARRPVKAEEWEDSAKPIVSVVVPAFNEADNIAQRIDNLFELNWPADRLEIIISSDGSDDDTNAIVHELAEDDPRIRLLALPRGGQTSAINAGVQAATGELVIITDAATRFDPDVLRSLSTHFRDPRIHCVVGEVSMLPLGKTPVSRAEALYWRFEAVVRHLEAMVGIGFVGSGACTMARREFFPELLPTASSDLELTLKLLQAGGRIIQLNGVGVYDYMDGDISGQLRSRPRRVRKSLTTVANNKSILNPFRYPRQAFAIVSHKILRWLTGLWMLGMLVTSGALAFVHLAPLYIAIFWIQAAFYLLALIGLALAKTSIASNPLLAVPLSVTVVAAAFLKGVVEFIGGKRDATHQPQPVTPNRDDEAPTT